MPSTASSTRATKRKAETVVEVEVPPSKRLRNADTEVMRRMEEQTAETIRVANGVEEMATGIDRLAAAMETQNGILLRLVTAVVALKKEDEEESEEEDGEVKDGGKDGARENK